MTDRVPPRHQEWPSMHDPERPTKATPGELSDGPLMPKSKTRAPFFRRHSRFISFLGALIVLSTFVVKEGLSDRWKGDADTVEQAQLLYAVHEEAATTYDIASDIWIKLTPIHDSAAPASVSAFEGALGFIRLEASYVESWNTSANHVGELLGRLPQLKAELAVYKPLASRLFAYRTYLDDASKWVRQNENNFQVEPDPKRKAAIKSELNDDVIQRVFNRWVTVGEPLGRQWKAFVEKVMPEAEAIRLSDEAKADRAWWIATVLYALGWGLAVVGQLYGAPVKSED